MSSFRTQRVVIASLFLPDTIFAGGSPPQTPTRDIDRRHSSPPPATSRPALQSIVDDLRDKSIAPAALRSPQTESLTNPFTPLVTTRRSPARSSSRHRPQIFENWHLEPNPQANGGLKNAIDSLSPAKLKSHLWVGVLGPESDSLSPALRPSLTSTLATSPHPSLPVWVPDDEFHSAYAEFCHTVLWPCLHYAVPDAPKTKLFNTTSSSFAAYASMNQRFADAIISTHQDGDVIWINDYHLMLLPYLLRSSGKIPPTTPIGFFMHVAFPSSEIFRCLSVRTQLLRGILGADLVGFQTASYARHFRQTVSRIMAYEALPKGIQVADGDGAAADVVITRNGLAPGSSEGRARGRFVDVGAFPMGIDVAQLKQKKEEPEVKEWIDLLQQRYAGMKIVVGRDKLDEVQGVRHKIKAFEYFLESHPEFQGKAILIQIALPTQSPHSHTASHPIPSAESAAVTEAIHRINSRFSTLTYQPIVFLHTQDLTFSQYLALLSSADAFIVTSLREGMALRTHEFVECQEGKWGVLVLSEFTGSYSYSGFRSCIAINPWDTRGTAEAINQALTMSQEEALMRWEDLHNHVTTQTAQKFVTTFLNRTLRAHAEDLGAANFNAEGVPSLRVPGGVGKLVPRYRHSRKRMLLLDLEGTLWVRDLSRDGLAKMEEDYKAAERGLGLNIGSSESGDAEVEAKKQEDGEEEGSEGKSSEEPKIQIPEEVIEVLEKLVADRRNEVWLLSGLKVKGLLERIGERVPRLGIVAENGCFIKTIKALSYHASRSSNYASSRSLSLSLTSTSSLMMSPPPLERRKSEATPTNNKAEEIAGGQWINMVANFNLTWKGPCLEILNYFTERTPGSFIEERDASIVWRFWTGGPSPTLAADDGNVPESSDRQWARRQAAEAQNHIFDSLGERYGLRIIPGKNSFLVLPNNVSRSTAVGAILHPGGPAQSPVSQPWMSSNVHEDTLSSGAVGGAQANELDFILAISGDEKLLRRLNEIDGAETASTSGRGTDAKWKVDPAVVVDVLKALANAASSEAPGTSGSRRMSEEGIDGGDI